ncbi:MAG: hypothetical protein ACOY3P_26550 [Planctomycetota bacterium]
MSEDLAALNMVQLRKALQQAALPAERQIARLKGWDVPFEVADDVYQASLWVLQSEDVKLSDEQRSSLTALDQLTDAMSGPHTAELWTEDALRSRPEWDEVRRRAREILALFGWPLEDTDVPQDERVMLRQALRVAALPADEQIASFPKGSPVPEWIAGDFFNWSGLALYRADFAPTDQQRTALNALYTRLNEMSERHEQDTELWTEEGLRRRPEWTEVRREARKILELFQWAMEDEDAGGT